jgi:ATP adenylyltransferase
MAYIDSDRDFGGRSLPKHEGCIFCEKSCSSRPEQDLVVFKGSLAFVLLNLYPYNNGHLMIAPLEHGARYDLLDPATMAEMDSLLQRCLRALEGAFKPDGFNIGMNLGKVAGAGIADHLHLHVVPRWTGDSNFMPVIGETKVMPDSLESSYSKIVANWQ